jgi:hypothetical protein
VLRFIKLALALADFIGIAFLLSFLQIALTLGNFLALFGDFLLMFGFELTVAAVRSDFTKRFVQTINPVLVVMFSA